MAKNSPGREIARRDEYAVALRTFEHSLTQFIEDQGLPADSVFVGLDERARVFQNVDAALTFLSPEQLQGSTYIAKLIAPQGRDSLMRRSTIYGTRRSTNCVRALRNTTLPTSTTLQFVVQIGERHSKRMTTSTR